MIGGVVGLRPTRRITPMMGELAAQRTLDNGFLEAANRGVELLMRDRALANRLVEDLGRNRRQRRLRLW
jgi:hypothetical protein